jgi:hypothetical protein
MQWRLRDRVNAGRTALLLFPTSEFDDEDINRTDARRFSFRRQIHPDISARSNLRPARGWQDLSAEAGRAYRNHLIARRWVCDRN